MPFFKVAMISFYLVSAWANADRQFLGRYTCAAEGYAVSVDSLKPEKGYVSSQLFFTIVSKDKAIFIEEFAGHIMLWQHVGSDHPKSTPQRYGLFKKENWKFNRLYNPRKYTEHIQFKKMDSLFSVGSEDGMWGEFILNKGFQTLKSFDAHYVFQSGDHLGGTIHFDCEPQ